MLQWKVGKSWSVNGVDWAYRPQSDYGSLLCITSLATWKRTTGTSTGSTGYQRNNQSDWFMKELTCAFSFSRIFYFLSDSHHRYVNVSLYPVLPERAHAFRKRKKDTFASQPGILKCIHVKMDDIWHEENRKRQNSRSGVHAGEPFSARCPITNFRSP